MIMMNRIIFSIGNIFINHKSNVKGGDFIKIGLKITITGMLMRMLAVGATGLRPSLMYTIMCVIAFILCVGGIILFEFDSCMSVIFEIAQIAGTIALFISYDIALAVTDVVFTVLFLYGLLQVLIHGNPVYVIYILW